MRYCIIINNKESARTKALLANYDLAELRIDLTGENNVFISNVLAQNVDIIATYRPVEGISLSRRHEVLKYCISLGAKFIDLEIETPENELIDMISYAKAHNVQVILSHHNYNETEPYSELYHIAKKCANFEPAYIKIATYINNSTDLKSIFRLYSDFDNIIAIGMGPEGRISRITSHYLDVPIYYVQFGHSDNLKKLQTFTIVELKRILRYLKLSL